MSRHEISGPTPGDRVVVGWDHPLLTFFVHVFKAGSKRRDGPDVWLGVSLRELYDLEDLKRAIRPHADLEPDLLSALYMDRDEGR